MLSWISGRGGLSRHGEPPVEGSGWIRYVVVVVVVDDDALPAKEVVVVL